MYFLEFYLFLAELGLCHCVWAFSRCSAWSSHGVSAVSSLVAEHVSHVLHRGDGAVAGDPGRCLPHAPLAQTEGSISVSLKQLYFPNVPSPSTDAISFPESFQLDSKWPFIALCKF